MQEKILDMVKNYAEGAVATQTEIPEDKKRETVQATTEAITDGLKQNFHLSNLANLTSLFTGGGNSLSATSTNPIMGSIQTGVVNALVQRVGLSRGIATSLASTVVPSLINAFTQKTNDPSDKGFSLESLIGAFSGGSNKQSGAGVLDTIGKLLS